MNPHRRIGLRVGIAAAWTAGGLLERLLQLYETAVIGVHASLGSAILVVVAAAAASYVPVRAATRVPVMAEPCRP